MWGSRENAQVGLRLIVPALTLVLPAVILIAALLALPAPEPVAVPVAAEIAVDSAADVAVSMVAEIPATEEAASTTIAVPVETPPPATPPPATPLPTPRLTPTPQPSWGGPQTFTFVALGVDQRNDREIPRTDTIMIGKVDLRTPKVNLISIPRDLLVEIPGYGKDRINAAYVYGEQFKEAGGGIGLLQRTIEKNFGIQIDHFGLLDFQCFRTAVDSVGGVTVNVPRAIVDPKYPTEDYGTKLVKFEVGVQQMDGERALEYARTRSADSDFQRVQRQQLIIAAMRDQVLQLRTLPSMTTLLTGCRNMRSDLGWRDYLTLGTSLQSLNSGRIAFAAIDEKMVTDTTLSTGAAVLLPRWDPIRTLVAESFGTGASTSTARSGAVVAPSPSPQPFSPSEPVAGPSRIDSLPDDPPVYSVPSTPSPRRT